MHSKKRKAAAILGSITPASEQNETSGFTREQALVEQTQDSNNSEAPTIEDTLASKSKAFQKLEAFALAAPTSSRLKTSRTTVSNYAEKHIERSLDDARAHVPARILLTEAPVPPEEHEENKDAVSCVGEIIPGACEALVTVARDLVAALEGLKFAPPVTCVYNPLVYAGNLHEQYIRKHGGRRIEVLLIGMNPGPFGMAQTGVPFGDSSLVRDFHGITGKVEPPVLPHPKRPIYGMECPRHEVSGQRLWGWARERFGSATAFFKRFWVYNYCPLVFMETSGKNRTPDKLPLAERKILENACNEALAKTITILQPKLVVGIGKYSANKIRATGIRGIKVGDIMHPSPANPHANKGWSKIIEAQLEELGVVFDKQAPVSK